MNNMQVGKVERINLKNTWAVSVTVKVKNGENFL